MSELHARCPTGCACEGWRPLRGRARTGASTSSDCKHAPRGNDAHAIRPAKPISVCAARWGAAPQQACGRQWPCLPPALPLVCAHAQRWRRFRLRPASKTLMALPSSCSCDNSATIRPLAATPGPAGMSYFDIAEIVAEEERLPCTFLTDAELIGYLDSTSDREVSKASRRAATRLAASLPRGLGLSDPAHSRPETIANACLGGLVVRCPGVRPSRQAVAGALRLKLRRLPAALSLWPCAGHRSGHAR